MSDSQFSDLLGWIGDLIGDFFATIGSGFDHMTRMHWFVIMIGAVMVGYLCMRGMRANQRM